MNIYRSQDNTPDIYNNESRDFQVLERLLDIIVNDVRFETTTIPQSLDTSKCPDRLLQLLQTKLGYFSNKSISSESLRKILLAFPYIIKYKGSKEGIEKVVELFLRINNIKATSDSYSVNIINKEKYNIDNDRVELTISGTTSKYFKLFNRETQFPTTVAHNRITVGEEYTDYIFIKLSNEYKTHIDIKKYIGNTSTMKLSYYKLTYISSSEETPYTRPAYTTNTYYQRTGTEGACVYTLLTSAKPNDWDTASNKYYERTGSVYKDIAVGKYLYQTFYDSIELKRKDDSHYYIGDDTLINPSSPITGSFSYCILFDIDNDTYKIYQRCRGVSQPSEYSATFVYDAIESITLYDKNPLYWYTNYNDYQYKDINNEYINYTKLAPTFDSDNCYRYDTSLRKYLKIENKPADWDSNYFDYYIKQTITKTYFNYTGEINYKDSEKCFEIGTSNYQFKECNIPLSFDYKYNSTSNNGITNNCSYQNIVPGGYTYGNLSLWDDSFKSTGEAFLIISYPLAVHIYIDGSALGSTLSNIGMYYAYDTYTPYKSVLPTYGKNPSNENVSTYSIKDLYKIIIKFYIESVNGIDTLNEILKYILPIGYLLEFSFASKSSSQSNLITYDMVATEKIVETTNDALYPSPNENTNNETTSTRRTRVGTTTIYNGATNTEGNNNE